MSNPNTGVPAPQRGIGWKTILGGVLVAVAPVIEQAVPGFTETTQAVIQAIGGIIGIFGIRTAISKNGRGV